MATALDVIERAMSLAGVYSIGETPSPAETTSGLQALNGMIESWANESLMIYARTSDTIPLVASTSLYTLGATGTFVTTRPAQALDVSYVIYQNVSYPVPALTLDQYNTIPYKLQTSEFPWSLWYEPNFPNGSLTVYPTPSASSSLVFWSLKQLSSFASLTTDVALPPGYFDALSFNLAVLWGPEYDGTSIPQSVAQAAINSKRVLKRTNFKPLPMRLPGVVLPQYGHVNWRAGV